MHSSHLYTARRISLTAVALSMVAFMSLSASSAMATDVPWSPPVTVADAYGNANATVVSPNGTITTVTETALGIAAVSSTDAGVTWQPAILLGSGGDAAFRPAVGVTSSGLLAAAWVEENAGNRTIHVVTSSDDGAHWGAPIVLPSAGTDVDNPVIGSPDANSVTIAWNQNFFDKYTSTSTNGGATFSAPQPLTVSLNSYGSTSLVSTAPTTLTAFFQEFDGGSAQYSVKSRTSIDGGATWGSKVAVSGDWSGSLGNSIYLGLTSPATGMVVAVWTRGVTGGGDALFAASSNDLGGTWTAPVTVSATADSLRNFWVESVGGSSVGIAWYSQTGSKTTLQYATLDVGAIAVSAPVTVAETSSTSYGQRLSLSTSGTTRVVSWYQYGKTSATNGYRVSASCDAGATWTRPVALDLGSTISSNDAVTVVSGSTFSGVLSKSDSGASGSSLFSVSSTTPCDVAALAGSTLPATGLDVLPLGLLSVALLAFGCGFWVISRRRVA